MGLARQIKRLNKRLEWNSSKRRRRKAFIEALEQRVLLSADLSFTTNGSANDLKLLLDNADGTDKLQLEDDRDPFLLDTQLLAGTKGAEGFGSEFDHTLTMDPDSEGRAGDISGQSMDVTISDSEYADNIDLFGMGDMTGVGGVGISNSDFNGFENLATHEVTGDAGLELIFVDVSVPDYESLLDQITSRDSESYEVVILDSDRDGFAQISQALERHRGISAVHILSHGEAGMLRLGNSLADKSVLSEKTTQLGSWQTALNPAGDILLYGCNVAEGGDGMAFIEKLAELTNGDVAASDDPTGAGHLGGDWVLEQSTGLIETENLFLSGVLPIHPDLLLAGTAQPTIDGTDTADIFTIKYVSANDASTVSRSPQALDPANTVIQDDATINGGPGDDQFKVNEIKGTTLNAKNFTFDGGPGSDTLDFSSTLNDKPLYFTIGSTSISVECLVNETKVKILTAKAIENIIGSKNDDIFYFEAGTILQGKIDGGGGGDTLDYTGVKKTGLAGLFGGTTGYSTKVQIDLSGTPGGDGYLLQDENPSIQGLKNIEYFVGGGAGEPHAAEQLDKRDKITGSTGQDTLFGGGGGDKIYGEGGDDILFGDLHSADILIKQTIPATPEADRKGDDVRKIKPGDDDLYGGAGADQLYGGKGDDRLYGDGTKPPATPPTQPPPCHHRQRLPGRRSGERYLCL